MPANKVLLIRHGQTAFNLEHRLQGAMPVPLNERGRTQSRALAQYLKSMHFDILYSSPMLRALETAQIIADVTRHETVEDARLGEIAFGDFEGHTLADVEELFPQAYRQWQAGYRPYRVPGGESRLDVQIRMRAAWQDIVAKDDIGSAAIIGHGSATMIFLASLFAQLPQKPLPNTSITILSRFRDIWEISAFGETPHLPA